MCATDVDADRGQSRGTRVAVSCLKAAHCDGVGYPLRPALWTERVFPRLWSRAGPGTPLSTRVGVYWPRDVRTAPAPRTSGSAPEPHPAVPHPCAVPTTGTIWSADEGEAKHDDQSTNALEHADSLKRDEEGVDTPPGPRHVTIPSLDQSVERPPARKTTPEHRGRLEGTVRRSIPHLGLQLVAELLNIPSRTNQFQPPAEEEAGHPGQQRSGRATGNAAGNHLVDTGPCPITDQSSRLSPPPPPQIHQRLPAPGHATPPARPRSI